ncbi:MAG: restriction endonuclease subunit S [Beijerinckiaceae bacterium]
MNAERLLAHYEHIADAPDAIDRLRRFILDLAVRGKLVPQDPADESASKLLKRLGRGLSNAGRKARREAEGAEPEYVLPSNWCWVRIGDHLDLVNGMAFKPTDWLHSGLKIVRIQNLNRLDAPFNYCDPKNIRERFLIDDGAFLISWSGTPGTSFGAFIWNRGPAVLNQHIFRCDFRLQAFDPQYLRLAINGRLDEMIAKAHGGVGLQHITKGKLEALLIALPPIAEQRHIVAKVDELMVLCDRLETARAEREAVRDRLAAASFARLNAPDPATFHDDARFALDALQAITTRPDQIKQLRQTILNLAVHGTLVPQDPKDGTASELLKRIVVAKGRSRCAIVTVESDAEPFSLPKSWKWAALDELITSGPQNGLSPKPTTREDAPMAITLTATTSGVFKPAHFKRVEAMIPDDSDFWLKEGDLLFQRGNTRDYVGIAAVYEGPPNTFLFPDLIMKVRVSDLVSLRFVHLASVSPPARAYLSANASGAQATMPKINQTTLVSLPIPLPPRGEQHRIVAKVDELMALCDRLEASLTDTDDTRRRLLDALLAEALAQGNDAATVEAARLAAHGGRGLTAGGAMGSMISDRSWVTRQG